MKNAIIIIPTHTSYLDISHNFIQLLKKYWPNCPYPVIISAFGNNNEIKHKTNVIFNPEAKSLIDCISSVASKYSADFYFSFLGDAFLDGNVNQNTIDDLLEVMQENNIKYCNLTKVTNYRKKVQISDYLREINSDDRYSHSFVAFVASASYINDTLKKFKSDLDFEKYYLSLSGKNIYYADHLTVTRNIFHIVPGITQGKWDRIAIRKLKKDNPEITFASREMRSWPDTIIYHAHDLLIGYIPNNLRYCAKTLISRITRKKFITNT